VEQKTLTLEEALEAWCDQSRVNASLELKPYRMMLGFVGVGPPSAYELNWRRWWDLREPLEEEFIGKLKAGILLASGFAVPITPTSHRQQINPELWNVLEPNFEDSSAKGGGLEIVNIRVALAETLATTDGVAAADPVENATAEVFFNSPNYEKVSLRGHNFVLHGYQCQIIRLLHEASRTPLPDVSGKELLETVGSSGNSIGDLFRRHKNPSWRELIAQPRRGYYRLNLSG